MVNPESIVDAIVAKIRNIAGVITLVGDSSAVYAYKPLFPEAASLAEALNDMPTPSVLVCYRGFSTGIDAVSRVHNVSVFVVPDGSPWSLLFAILSGVPVGSAEKFADLEVMSELDPPHEYSVLDPTQEDFAGVTFDLYSLQLAYREKRN